MRMLNEKLGNTGLSEVYFSKARSFDADYYHPMTRENYRKIKNMLDDRGVQLVCVQYPVRSIDPLKNLFDDTSGIIFVDNEKSFKDAIEKEGYNVYFMDRFAGEFGHCTPKGNELLAGNIADEILKELSEEDGERVDQGVIPPEFPAVFCDCMKDRRGRCSRGCFSPHELSERGGPWSGVPLLRIVDRNDKCLFVFGSSTRGTSGVF